MLFQCIKCRYFSIWSSSMQINFSSCLLFLLLLMLEFLCSPLPLPMANLNLPPPRPPLLEKFRFSIFTYQLRSILGKDLLSQIFYFPIFQSHILCLFSHHDFSFLYCPFRLSIIFTFDFFLVFLRSTFSSCHTFVFIALLIS